jgi:hypothetical protein
VGKDRAALPALSRLQHRILAWLWAEETRTQGTMAASHQGLVQALGHDTGNLSVRLLRMAIFARDICVTMRLGLADAVVATAWPIWKPRAW